MKIARRASGEHYIECPVDLWDVFLQARERDDSQPWPMPVGHMMFTKPDAYGITMIIDMRKDAMVDQALNILRADGVPL